MLSLLLMNTEFSLPFGSSPAPAQSALVLLCALFQKVLADDPSHHASSWAAAGAAHPEGGLKASAPNSSNPSSLVLMLWAQCPHVAEVHSWADICLVETTEEVGKPPAPAWLQLQLIKWYSVPFPLRLKMHKLQHKCDYMKNDFPGRGVEGSREAVVSPSLKIFQTDLDKSPF